MIELLMLLTLSPMNTAPAMTAGFQPCVYPNPCGAAETIRLAEDFTTCVYPNPCGAAEGEETILAAGGFQPCVYPNPCGKQAAVEVAQFQHCVYPNPCGVAKERLI